MLSSHRDITTTGSHSVESDVLRLGRCLQGGRDQLSEMLNVLSCFAKRNDILPFHVAEKIAHFANSTELFYKTFVRVASDVGSHQSQEAMMWSDSMIAWVFKTICRSEDGKKQCQERMRDLFADKENLPLQLQSQSSNIRWQRLTAPYGVSIRSGRSTPKDKLISRAFQQFSKYLLHVQSLSTQAVVSAVAVNTGISIALNVALKELRDKPGSFGLSATNSEGAGQFVASFASKGGHPNEAQAQHFRNLVRFCSLFRGGALPVVEGMIKNHLKDEVLARWVGGGTDSSSGQYTAVRYR